MHSSSLESNTGKDRGGCAPRWLWLLLLAGLPAAAGPAAAGDEPAERKERVLYVPFQDLSLILSGPNERVFMTLEQYRQLEAEAAKKPPSRAPQPVVVLSANYDAQITDNLATLTGAIELEVLDPGLHKLPLLFQGVALRTATLDDGAAPIARDPSGPIVLFVRGAGRHELNVTLQVPVVVAAAQQSLQFNLPQAGSTRLHVTVPGNVEVKSGASVVQRAYDTDADHTTFELLPDGQAVSLVMSLNNRRLRSGRVVAARSVLVSELTTSYERLHLTSEMRVLHGAVDRFLFDVPSGFQVTSVQSPLLAQWVLRKDGDQDVLEVILREPTRETEQLSISASRAPVTIGQWTMPHFRPRDVAGHVSIVGLIAESRLRPLGFEAENLIRLDTSVLREQLPSSVFDTEPGAPAILQFVAYYAPSEDYSLQATIENPRDQLHASTHLLLSLDEKQQTLRGGFTLTPQASKLVSVAFQLPAQWQLENLHGADQQPLPFDRYQGGVNTRYVVVLPTAIEPSASQTLFFQASYRSSDWLTPWDSKEVAFPQVVIDQVTTQSGAIAVQANGDLVATPLTTEGLVPLDSKERSRFGLEDSSSELTYEFANEAYRATFQVLRRQPRLSSRNYSFFQVQDGQLIAHHEVAVRIENAHADQLELRLPASTPTALAIRALDDVQLKEYSHETVEDQHRWKVSLAQPQIGVVRLIVDYDQRLEDPETERLTLPLIQSAGVAYQTQMVAIEGDTSLDISVNTPMRRVDIGELAEADYAPGARLLGAYASTKDGEGVEIGIARRQLQPLPAAIIKRAELVTVVASSGISQSSVRYQMETKVPYLALDLPADTELWSVTLDGQPIKPRRRGDQVLLSLPTGGSTQDLDLQVVYETPVRAFRWLGNVQTHAPQLRLLLDEQDTGAVVPQVDLVWHVLLPSGYRVSQVRGSVFSDDVERPQSPWKTLSMAATVAGGGIQSYGFGAMRRLASSKRPAMRGGTEEEMSVQSAEMAAGDEMMDMEVDMPSAAQPGYGSGYGSDYGYGATPPAEGGAEYGGYEAGENMPMSGRRRAMGGEPEGRERAAASRAASGPLPPPLTPPPARPQQDRGANQAPPTAQPAVAQPQLPQQQAAPQTVPPPADISGSGNLSSPMIDKYWALQGLRGLAIQIDRRGQELTFRSLGTDPELDITVFQQSRIQWLALAAGLLVLVAGLLLTRRSIAKRASFVVLVALLAAGLPVLGGPTTAFSIVFQAVLVAVFALIPLWVMVAVLSRVWNWLVRHLQPWTSAVTAGLLLVLAVHSAAPPAQAQELRELLKPLLDEHPAVTIPADAVVVPYDPDDVQWRANANKVLVPYQRYVELWNLAHPDQKIQTSGDERTFAFTGASYKVTLADDEQLLLTGSIGIELFTDQPVDVPLALRDGIISDATLDDQRARLKTIITQPPVPNQQEPQRQQQRAVPAVPPGVSLLSLLVEGQGRHELKLTVRVAVQRQGGSRTVSAVVPAADATSVDITVPEAGTTVRRTVHTVTLSETTEQAGQTLSATLQSGGVFELAWRPKTSPGAVDQALTANSMALVDVREDGIRVIWQVKLIFGQTERGTFRLEVPEGYLVERVDGSNVRGWETATEQGHTVMTVELLKAVKQQEEMTIHLSQRTATAQEQQRDVTVPAIIVPDAALHRGIFQVRRSPILELQTRSASGVARTDGAAVTKALEPLIGEQKSPLGIQEYQAYEFAATPFQVSMTAARIQPRIAVQLRTIFRIGETESALESEIRFTPLRRGLFQADVAIPADLKLERVLAPGLSDWSVIQQQGRSVLRAFFSSGHADPFALSIEGRLGNHTADQAVALPQLEVLDVDQQQGIVVVQVDPSLEAKILGLTNCQNALLERTFDWLNQENRALARLAVEYLGGDYAGQIQLSRRPPQVTCNTYTNVRVTYHEIQETILLDYVIRDAGVREIRFLLPQSLSNANIVAPRTRQQSITPVANEPYVEVALQLQEAITGQYLVVVNNDRAIAAGPQTAPLPIVDAEMIKSRYVTLENAGRDEIVIGETQDMGPVDRQSRQWDQLTGRIQGGDLTTAYVATGSSKNARFGYQTKQRSMVVTAGARIGLARTLMVVDASGAYRASMLLKVDNRTEPYLEIQLPEASQLWTAHVAGRPVKPAKTPGVADDSRLRIPLIKTAEGDLDYEVVLKYAGRLRDFGLLSAVEFPMVQTHNINIELSQVQLYLPEEYHWYNFDGNATEVEGEGDFDAGEVAYETQQIEKQTQIIRGKDTFSQSRAIYNVKKRGEELKQWLAASKASSSNEQLQLNINSFDRVLEAAQQEIQQLQEQEETAADNRAVFNSLYEQQRNGFAGNSAARLRGNFDATVQVPQQKQSSVTKFNNDWFLGKGQNKQVAESKDAKKLDEKAGGKSAGRLIQDESYRVQQQLNMPSDKEAAQQVFQREGQSGAQTGQASSSQRGRRNEAGTKSELNRAYMDKIQRSDQPMQGMGEPYPSAQMDTVQSIPAGGQQMQQQADFDMSLPLIPGMEATEVAGRAGLASLGFELPTRGSVFYFTTPRGEVEITARPVDRELQNRLANFATLLAIIGVLLIVVGVIRRLARTHNGRVTAVVLLCCVGLGMVLFGCFPIFGLAMFLGSVLLAIDIGRRARAT